MVETIKIVERMPFPEPSRLRNRSTQFLRMVKLTIGRVRRGHPELEGTSLYDVGVRRLPEQGLLEVTLYFRTDKKEEAGA